MTTEAADPLLLGHHKAEQPGGPKQGDEQQQQPENNWPDLRKAIGEPKAWVDSTTQCIIE